MLLIERKMRGDQGQDASRFQGIQGFGQEKVMQGEALARILDPVVHERHVADHRIDAACRQAGIDEIFDADIVVRIQRAGDAS